MEQTPTKFHNFTTEIVADACVSMNLPKTRYSLKTRASAGCQNIVSTLLFYRWAFKEEKLYTTSPQVISDHKISNTIAK